LIKNILKAPESQLSMAEVEKTEIKSSINLMGYTSKSHEN